MGTWWSKGSELGVALATLGLVISCGGKYAVGSGETEGQGGESGAADTGNGGSKSVPMGGASQGGNPATGGRASSGSGGATAGAAGAPIGGSASGGSGEVTCLAPAGPLPEFTPAPPDVVWDRICRFLSGPRSPFEPLPETTTVEWVRGRVDAVLAEQYVEDERAPGGLETFFREWAFPGEEVSKDGGAAAFWAKNFARPAGNFADFFAPMGDPVADRVSFLSDRSFLTYFETSTQRGVWMSERLVCNGLSAPPGTIHGGPVTVPPDKTSRQAMEEATAEAVCVGCHSIIGPLGFSLEHYDSLGDYRTTENGLPIDSSGVYSGPGAEWTFVSIADLSTYFIGHCETQTCFASQLLSYALVRAYPEPGSAPSFDAAELAYVTREFKGHYLALAPLLQAIATTPAFLRE